MMFCAHLQDPVMVSQNIEKYNSATIANYHLSKSLAIECQSKLYILCLGILALDLSRINLGLGQTNSSLHAGPYQIQ